MPKGQLGSIRLYVFDSQQTSDLQIVYIYIIFFLFSYGSELQINRQYRFERSLAELYSFIFIYYIMLECSIIFISFHFNSSHENLILCIMVSIKLSYQLFSTINFIQIPCQIIFTDYMPMPNDLIDAIMNSIAILYNCAILCHHGKDCSRCGFCIVCHAAVLYILLVCYCMSYLH